MSIEFLSLVGNTVKIEQEQGHKQGNPKDQAHDVLLYVVDWKLDVQIVAYVTFNPNNVVHNTDSGYNKPKGVKKELKENLKHGRFTPLVG